MPRADSKLYRTLPYILAIPMVLSGAMILTGRMAAQFVAWGYPGWFSQFTGLLELIAAVLLFLPKRRFWGASLMACVMTGAVVTHLIHGEAANIGPAALLGVVAALVAYKYCPFLGTPE